jgi:DNA helicase-2/ATP-dependent DNA helicase PcrA
MSYNNRYRTGLVSEGSAKKKWNPSWGKKGPIVARGSMYRPLTNPSAQQSAIINDVASNPDHLVCIARAGCGKTSTIVEALRHVPQGKSIMYVVFNSRNSKEAEGKCEERVRVSTIHAYGLSCIRKAFGKGIEVDDKGDKSYNISLALFGPEDEKAEIRHHFIKGMSLAKSYLCSNVDDVIEMCDKHGIEFGDMNAGDFAAKILEGLALSARQYMRVEFDDMPYLPIALNLTQEQFDVVALDESQDASPNRIQLVLRAIKPGGKLISIGDDKQSVYAFTGSDAHAMHTITTLTNAHTLPLTVTYRCSKRVVELAQTYVPEYTAAPSNLEGEVADRTLEQMMKPYAEGGAGPGDFVLSRVNAPLVKLCLSFVREGRKACVMGKDLGKSLTWMLKRSEANSVAGFLVWLDAWKNTECEKLVVRNKPCDVITDKYDTLVYLTDGTNDLGVVRQRITDMFSDDNMENIITCSSGHKSKGMERKRVWILTDGYKRCMAKAKSEFEVEQEENIFYVSITRSIETLYMVR